MIDPTREEVAVALFNLLKNNTAVAALFKTISRRPQVWAQTTDMPAMYLGQPDDEDSHQNGTSTPDVIEMEFYVYVQTDSGLEQNIAPDTQVNNAIDVISNAIAVPFGQTQKLGIQNVNHAWVDGGIHRAPGYLNGRGETLMTIKILVPQ